ncbi:MAG: hypothetical protein AB7I25_00815 [Vicinamibacterales bacterium]
MRREQKELHSRKILRGRYMWVGLLGGAVAGIFAMQVTGNGAMIGVGAVAGVILSQAIYSRG